ncbi:hypothetical protein ADIS_3899 [Lunatimonas lonarensis]|uniref:Uncharacterized protein n=1 Tax=Lunatimonas lonarensis TaxID=1232681 RepID=R7ZN18_9BACT|nr:hypothetical protein ADIS_3899 [Lunatimonas lonarensis]
MKVQLKFLFFEVQLMAYLKIQITINQMAGHSSAVSLATSFLAGN